VDTPVSYSSAAPARASLRATAKDTNVIICVLDAARVDHFSGYGYPRPTTPNFDRLARQGLLFDQHFCEAPKTKPSTVSLLTGLYPDSHGVSLNTTITPLSPSLLTLEHAFAQAGYATYLLSANSVASPEFGLGEDFQRVRFLREGAGKRADSIAWMCQELSALLPQWQTPGTRFFAYLHVLPPHLPYHAPAALARAFQGRPPRYWRGPPAQGGSHEDYTRQSPPSWVDWVNAYDANLRWADSFLGELEQALRRTGLLERTLLIVTADHGEALLEHGFAFHGNGPYDEDLHIPLLLRFPGPRKPAGRVHALTQTVDLFPTLLDLYGIPYPRAQAQGKSLLPLLAGEARTAHAYLVAQTGTAISSYVVRDAHFTLLIYPRGKKLLYDMDKDPWQTRNIYQEQRARAAPLEQAFVAFAQAQRYPPEGFPDLDRLPPRARPPAPSSRSLTDEQRRTLKALGYVE
jgi:arylsulfatase A-like enzyme